ncbi:CP2 transcription factor-domain-containing protein [Phycomyces nitens]|nr:CP2 transcription factor-domain-containing protein [Phycomyces nitens]
MLYSQKYMFYSPSCHSYPLNSRVKTLALEQSPTPDPSAYKHANQSNILSSLSRSYSTQDNIMLTPTFGYSSRTYASPHISPIHTAFSSPEILEHGQSIHAAVSPTSLASNLVSSRFYPTDSNTFNSIPGYGDHAIGSHAPYSPSSTLVQSNTSSILTSPTANSRVPVLTHYDTTLRYPAFPQMVSDTLNAHGKRPHSTSPGISFGGLPSHLHSRYHPRHQSANDTLSRRDTYSMNSAEMDDTSSFMKHSIEATCPPFFTLHPTIPDPVDEESPKTHLRFHIVLQAPTAVTQKTEESPVTYLNRGQAYAIQLNDRQAFDGMITSTLVIMFHDPSHRKVALNYWKFWVSQQKCSDEARAIDIDVKQSSGVHNVRYPSFDKITFEWNGCEGAKIFARFNCLSTDFSRIKGVKGIPLRAHMESHVFWPAIDLNSPSALQWAGNFTDLSPQFSNEDSKALSYTYLERSFSKIKLFRDKGAERKNKDDAKQIKKQFDKVYTEGDQQNNPMWLMYNHPLPYSVFGEIPTSPSLDSFRHAANDEQRQSGGSYRGSQLRNHNRIMTAPSSLFHKTFTPPSTFALRPLSAPFSTDTVLAHEAVTGQMNHFPMSGTLQTSPLSYEPMVYNGSRLGYSQGLQNTVQEENEWVQTSCLGIKRGYEYPFEKDYEADQPPNYQRSFVPDISPIEVNKRIKVPGIVLSFYVDITTPYRNQSITQPMTPVSNRTGSEQFERIHLESLTVQELTVKLCSVLVLHIDRVSAVLWKRPKSAMDIPRTDKTIKYKGDTILVLVEDAVVAQHIKEDAVIVVEWEIKADSTVRIILQF